mmetsp:Transcript_9768/g.35793  ORF Transcript_9768/g.35793 Transcript_9768/m.35793 type:complete len:140 (+) Transcript_9768:151-570(+)
MQRQLKIRVFPAVLCITSLQVLLWLFLTLSVSSTLPAEVANAGFEFESGTVNLFKSADGAPVRLQFEVDLHAIQLALKQENLVWKRLQTKSVLERSTEPLSSTTVLLLLKFIFLLCIDSSDSSGRNKSKRVIAAPTILA